MRRLRLLFAALSFFCLLASPPALAKEAENQEPGVLCTLVCWAHLDGWFDCQCSGGGGNAQCKQNCQNVLYARMASCPSVDPSDPAYESCIAAAYSGYDSCMAACG